MEARDSADGRIARIRRRYLDETPWISVERARYYTEKWNETGGSAVPLNVRVALSMKHVYEHIGMCVDPDDRIAGTWTENYLGIPVDIERGLFNETLDVELGTWTMMRYLLASNFRFLSFMVKKHGLPALYRGLRDTAAAGAAMPGIGLTPMQRRKINPYRIKKEDRRLLRETLLPAWRGKTITDLLRGELAASDVYSGDAAEFAVALPASTSRNDTILSTGAAMGTWQGHLILDHEKPLKMGLSAMRDLVRREMLSGPHSPDETHFLESLDIALEGVIIYARRLAGRVKEALEGETEPSKKRIFKEMHDICKKVPLEPASSFREAVQSYWTVKCAVELAVPFNVHAPGRLDQLFYPYYMKDSEEGRITPEEACELLEELFLKIMSHNMRPYSNFTGYFTQRYEGSEPVTLGGTDRDGADATNELTYVMLDAAQRSKAALNFVVRLHGKSPESLHLKIADLHYNGTSSISVMNDDVSVEALLKRGIERSDALDYAITGCVDMCAPGKTGGEGFSALLLCRILDMALRNGDSRTLVGTIRNAGPRTGDPDSFSGFGELVDAFLSQASFQIQKIVRAAGIRDRLYAENLPAPHISAFMNGCLQSKRDVTRGGAVYDCEGILFMNSIANTVDSLYVIKKLIFEARLFTFKDLIRALDNNYAGYEHMRRVIIELEGKWGNGHPESDDIARTVTTRLFEETYKYRSYKGGFFAPFINSMTAHTYDGRISMATPDGRKAARPYAASCNPYNVDRNGPTGVLRSVAAIDFSHVMGCAVNIRMHPTAIGQSQETRRKWISLIGAYFGMGGEQLQPTVVSTEVLREARENPELYRDVIVKVGGYSAYFTDLGHEIQNEIIERSEHRMV